VVNPNNPTGSALTAAERDRIDALAARAGAAVIADEVFFDYLVGKEARVSMAGPRSAASAPAALTFTLGGLSKACGLPQMKLGWILVDGPAEARAEALGRLEFIADSYLSVGAPVQCAAERLLALGDGIAALIRERVNLNRGSLVAAFPGGSASRVLPSDGGWYAVLQVPAVRSEEEMVLDLLARSDVLVHPGYFFDFEREAFLVLSLLPEPGVFGEALRRLRSGIAD
jgi:aspartate/methionine/tyrosine aminotransferase